MDSKPPLPQLAPAAHLKPPMALCTTLFSSLWSNTEERAATVGPHVARNRSWSNSGVCTWEEGGRGEEREEGGGGGGRRGGGEKRGRRGEEGEGGGGKSHGCMQYHVHKNYESYHN